MKSLHTLLGFKHSSKKQAVIAGFATMALAACVSAGNVNAIERDVYGSIDNLPDELYTLVGPMYFTFSSIESDELYDGNHYAYIEDTDIADFLVSPFGGGMAMDENMPPTIMECTDNYACIQGKKAGETNLIIEEDGEVVKRIHLVSGTFAPEYAKYIPSGVTYEGSGELTGIDNDLLKLVSVYTPSSKVQISKTGTRSLKITSNDTLDQGKVACGIWKIGNQYIGGGTNYNIIMVEVNDEASLNNANRDLLAFTTTSIFETIAYDPWNYGEKLMNGIDLPDLTVANGSKINIIHPGENEYWVAYMPGFPGSKYTIDLELINEDHFKDGYAEELKENLPEKATSVSAGAIHVEVNSVSPTFNSEDPTTIYIGEVVEFSDDITVTIQNVEVPELKAGYTRTWNVAFTDYEGETEVIDAEYDSEAKTLTFKTSKVGDFAFGYYDEFIPLVPDTGSALEKVAKTAAVSFLPLIALTGVAFGIRNRKKASHKLAKKIDR